MHLPSVFWLAVAKCALVVWSVASRFGGTKKDRGCVECSSRVSRRSARKGVRCNGSQKGIQDFIALIYPKSRPSDCSYDNRKFRSVLVRSDLHSSQRK